MPQLWSQCKVVGITKHLQGVLLYDLLVFATIPDFTNSCFDLKRKSPLFLGSLKRESPLFLGSLKLGIELCSWVLDQQEHSQYFVTPVPQGLKSLANNYPVSL